MICAMSKMLCAIRNMMCAMSKMLCVVCNMICMMMHVTLMEWLSWSKYGKFTNFPNPNLANLLTWLFINHVVRKELFLLMHVLSVCCIYPYIVQVCTNPIQYLLLGAGTGVRWSLKYDIAAIWTLSFHPDSVVEHVPLVFPYHFHFRLCIGAILAKIRLIQLWTISFIWWSWY